jgi:7-cyano-7-deazaguanine reductase
MTGSEGRRFEFADESQIRPDFLETFLFDSPEQYIMTETREFSAVCPFSGLPDLALVRIEYHPAGGCCVELKSLKYYLISFRNVGIFQEADTRRIFDDLRKALGTKRLRVTTIYNTRGGFDTTCVEGALERANSRRTKRTAT